MVSVLGVAVESKKWFQFFQFFSFFILRLGCVKSAENLAKIHRFFKMFGTSLKNTPERWESGKLLNVVNYKEKMKNSSQWRHFRSPLFRR